MEELTISGFLTKFNIELSHAEFYLSNLFFSIERINPSEETTRECRLNLDEALHHIMNALKAIRTSHTDLRFDMNVNRWYGITIFEWKNQFFFCKTRIQTILLICRNLVESKKLSAEQTTAIVEIVTALSLICTLYNTTIKEEKEKTESENLDFLDIKIEEIDIFFTNKNEQTAQCSRFLFSELGKSIDEIYTEFAAAKKTALRNVKNETTLTDGSPNSMIRGKAESDILFSNAADKMHDCFYIFEQMESHQSAAKEEYFFSQAHDKLGAILEGYKELFDTMSMKNNGFYPILQSYNSFSRLRDNYDMLIEQLFADSAAEKERFMPDMTLKLDIDSKAYGFSMEILKQIAGDFPEGTPYDMEQTKAELQE